MFMNFDLISIDIKHNFDDLSNIVKGMDFEHLKIMFNCVTVITELTFSGGQMHEARRYRFQIFESNSLLQMDG